MSKRCKLSIFPAHHFGPTHDEELLLHSEDFPGLLPGDVVEIYHPENEEEDEDERMPRLVLMVHKNSIYPDNQLTKPLNKETVYIEKSVAETFHLPNFKDVVVTKVVDKRDVALDSVELTFKEQYMGRSEMWRQNKKLVDTCVFLNKKVDLCNGHVRCQVNEMWGQGDKVSSGVVTPDTKVVFRSPTAMVYLFVQMSSEMWDFNTHGQLYFEKAVNGFLSEMFERWRKSGSSHEVTIVLFSRCFYAATHKAQFPAHMQDCLQIGYNDCYYEDFYRVVVQNERFDDWSPTLLQLNQIFTNYKKYILDYHKTPECTMPIPKPSISSAAQGNFLEVLNVSLNTFENHYLNRNLDRTGQQSIVITPGVGIFEVDRELTVITKQRIIDSGVGSDLICVGEQPLHAVPLLKFHHKDPKTSPSADYSMPHWINLSFYNKGHKVAYSNFTPRIKVPGDVEARVRKKRSTTTRPRVVCVSGDRSGASSPTKGINNLEFGDDADRYDDQVFELPAPHQHHQRSLSKGDLKRKMSDPELRVSDMSLDVSSSSIIPGGHDHHTETAGSITIPAKGRHDSLRSNTSVNSNTFYSSSLGAANDEKGILPHYMASEMSMKHRRTSLDPTPSGCPADTSFNFAGFEKSLMGSIDTTFDHQAIKKYLLRPGRALINPFDPSHTTIRVTSNRRRWIHIFPKGPTGNYQQVHHQAAVNGDARLAPEVLHTIAYGAVGNIAPAGSVNGTSAVKQSRDQALLWGATGEQAWSAGLTTGVDWKSLTIPASLPITTDYFPDPKSLVTDYVVNEYDLTPDEIFGDSAVEKSPLYGKQNMPTNEEVFTELISQRLAQGFQLILLPPSPEESSISTPKDVVKDTGIIIMRKSSSKKLDAKKTTLVMPRVKPSTEHWLSIGGIFHKVSLSGTKTQVKVTRYRPRHPDSSHKIHYRYRFRAPDNDNYEVSWVEFKTEKLENFNWNHMDFYVCTRGDKEFLLTENLKYWRFRTYALPLMPYLPYTRKIVDGQTDRCDIYNPCMSSDQKVELTENFARFAELCLNPNRIRKPTNTISTGPKRSATAKELRRCPTAPIQRGINDRPQMMMTPASSQARLKHPSGSSGPMSGSGLQHLSPSQPNLHDVGSSDQSGSYESHYPSSGEHHDQGHESDGGASLKITSTLNEIVDAMKDGSKGLHFVTRPVGMPPHTFVAIEAVCWLMEHVDGVNNEKTAIGVLRSMVEKNYICHASGNFHQPFVNGFYLYAICPNPRSPKSLDAPYGGDLETYYNDWVEVEISPRDECESKDVKGFSREPGHFSPNHSGDDNALLTAAIPPEPPEFLHPTMNNFAVRYERRRQLANGPFYKSVTFNVDQQNRSDRREWGHLKYQQHYDPCSAYEISLQWSVATASIIADLVHGWARKSQQGGLSVIPVPNDPFALPITLNSDPVRGPIFIELDTECLMENRSYLFEEFPESSWETRMFLFREAIAQRFGFVTCQTDRSQQPSSALFSTDHQYIHCTGNMFLLIPTQLQLQRGIQGIKARTSVAGSGLGASRARGGKTGIESLGESPSESGGVTHESFTRHLGQTKPAYDHSETGFLWSWNFMISRRWKQISNTGATGSIVFMDKMLADFRAFCCNDKNRLRAFWDECWASKRFHDANTPSYNT